MYLGDLTLKLLLTSLGVKKNKEIKAEKIKDQNWKKKKMKIKKQRLETLHYVTFTTFSHQCVKLNYNVPVVTFHTCFGNVFFQFCNHGNKSTRDLLQQFE